VNWVNRINSTNWVGEIVKIRKTPQPLIVAERLFEIATPLGFVVWCFREYWKFIATQKHPVLAGREKEVAEVLADPDEVRQSRKDADVFLFYRGAAPRWLCAVVRRDGEAGFLITAYPTDAIKAGVTVWTKSK